MLGAQTRAAEYYAAKKASARQASREAEEQKLPPPAAPISLSAFTRSAQPSRNKGLKAYVPLVLEQTPEADTEQEQEVLETPTRQQPTPDCASTSTSESSSVTKPRVMLPTMPRAMLVPGGPSANTTPRYQARAHMPPLQAHVSFPPPPHFQHAGFAYQTDHAFQSNEIPWPHMPFLQHQPYSWDHSGAQFKQQQASMTHSTPPAPFIHQDKPMSCPIETECLPSRQITPQIEARRFVFGPDDVSPGKHEEKMRILSRQPSDDEKEQKQTFDWADESDFKRPLLNPIRVRAPSSEDTDTSPPKKSDIVEHAPNMPSAMRPIVARQYDSEISSDTSHQRGLLPNPLRRYTDTDITSDSPVTAIPWNRSSIEDDFEVGDVSAHCQYERSTKMQKFEAVQQVLSRKGKTVLNNPERKIAPPVGPPPSVITCESGPGPSLTEDEARDLPNVAGPAVQPPPGLQKPDRPFEPVTNSSHEYKPAIISQADAELRESFGVMSDDWFNLKPVSMQDRKDMQAAMRHVRNKNANNGQFRPFETERVRKERLGASDWLQKDPRRFQAARNEIDQIANEYSARVCAGYRMPDETGADLAAGLVRGAGNILATLSENIIDSRAGVSYQNRFHHATKDLVGAGKSAAPKTNSVEKTGPHSTIGKPKYGGSQ